MPYNVNITLKTDDDRISVENRVFDSELDDLVNDIREYVERKNLDVIKIDWAEIGCSGTLSMEDLIASKDTKVTVNNDWETLHYSFNGKDIDSSLDGKLKVKIDGKVLELPYFSKVGYGTWYDHGHSNTVERNELYVHFPLANGLRIDGKDYVKVPIEEVDNVEEVIPGSDDLPF